MDGSTGARQANLLATLAMGLNDRIRDAEETAAGHGSAAPAALVALHEFLGGASIDRLRQVVGLTPSGAVRLIDKLERLWSRQAWPWSRRAISRRDAHPSWQRRSTAGLGRPPSSDRNTPGGAEHQRARETHTTAGTPPQRINRSTARRTGKLRDSAGRMALQALRLLRMRS